MAKHLRGETSKVTKKTPFAGKVSQTSCKCYHLIRIICATIACKTYTGKLS